MAGGQMAFIERMRSSDGRARIATVAGVFALVVAMALLVVDPASAGSGGQSGAGVQPTEISYGGGSGACDANFPGLPSAAQHELWINNPADGTFVGPDGTEVTIDVYANDTKFTFTINAQGVAAYDLVVNGGAKNTHFDYDGSSVGPVSTDTELHAPTKGGSSSLHKLSHINICYDAFTTNAIGQKYHDRDVDGDLDATKEEGLSGWTIAVFDQDGGTTPVRQTTTGADGSYAIGNLPAGNYVVCEATNTSGLPADGDNYEWAWIQSAPDNTDCAGYEGYEPAGYQIAGGTTEDTGIDFGNHLKVAINCSGPNSVSVTLGGSGTDDTPLATLTLPPFCESGTFTTTFDVSLSEDGDDWSQIVTVSGDPESGAEIIDLVIEWDSEARNLPLSDPLVVPNTKVVFDETAPVPSPLPDAVHCEPGGHPDSIVPTCLYARSIAEGGDLPVGDIQVTDHLKFIGDPKGAR
jgi:hypothetical protein